MKFFIKVLPIFISAIVIKANAQSFIKTISDSSNSLLITESIKTNDGGYAFAGRFYGVAGILKVDANGNQQWVKSYPLMAAFICLQKHSLGGFYTVNSTVGLSNCTIYITKTDSAGDIYWMKQFVFSGTFNRTPYDIAVGANDVMYIGLQNHTASTAQDQAMIMKVDSSGNCFWIKNYGSGYLWNDGINQIKVRPDSSIYILGYRGYAGGPGLYNACLSKFNNAGTRIYTKYFADGNYDIDFDSTGKILLTTTFYTSGPNPTSRVSIAAITDADTMLNFKSYSIGSLYMRFGYMTQSSNGDRLFTGMLNANSPPYHMFRFKTNASGNIIFAKIYNDTTLENTSIGPSLLNQNDIYEITPVIRSTSNFFSQLCLIKDDDLGQLCSQNVIMDTISEQKQMVNYQIDSSMENKTSSYSTLTVTPETFLNAQENLCLGASIESISEKVMLNIYPNPANDLLVIDYPALSGKEISVSISDITGKIIYTTTTNNSQKFEVNTKDFAQGIYFVQVQTNDFVQTRKVIVAR